MNKILGIIMLVMGVSMAGMAQEGFKITAQMQGMPDGKMYLITERGDTLTVADMMNGAFVLAGRVDAGQVAYIMTADRKGVIPVMLENAEFKVTANAQMVYVEGGPMQSLYNEFQAINASLLQERKRLEKEMQSAMQEQNQIKVQGLNQQFGQFMKRAQEAEMNLLKANNNTFVAAYIITQSMRQVEPEFLKERYNLLGEEAKASASGAVIADMIARYEMLEPGHVAPNFTARTPEGDTLSLYSVKGKVKLIDFWASWCGPCRKENPNVLKMYQKYHPKGLEIISVSLDDKEQAWKKAIDEDGLIWKHVSELAGQQSQIAQMYLLRTIPYTILLDENNVIIDKNLRGSQLQKKVAELLKK